MAFADVAAKARLLLAILAVLSPISGVAQTIETPAGLLPPDFKSEVSLNAALAELDRSAGTIVAEVGTRPITWGDVADQIRAMPAIVSRIPIQRLYQSAVVQVMQQKALALAAEKAGLEKDPLVQRRIKNAADQILAAEIIRRSLAPNLTDKALRSAYDGLVAGKPGPEEVQARIIMVDTREEATTLIQRLQGGADFSALAHDFSKDGTARNGGDLGFARLDMLTPEVGSVMFALAPGELTAFPVKSGNFWFIIKVESRRQPQAPNFLDARAALEQDVIHAGARELVRLALRPDMVRFFGPAGEKPAALSSK